MGRYHNQWVMAQSRLSSTILEVLKHIHSDQPDDHINMDGTWNIEVESKWFESRVRDAIHTRMGRPSLNRDEGRFNLSTVWDNTPKSQVQRGMERLGPRTSL